VTVDVGRIWSFELSPDGTRMLVTADGSGPSQRVRRADRLPAAHDSEAETLYEFRAVCQSRVIRVGQPPVEEIGALLV
jgi:hypothetical protein